jgi:hypothetical protein
MATSSIEILSQPLDTENEENGRNQEEHVFVDGIGKSAVVVKSPAVCGVSGSVMTACTRVSIPTSVNSYGNTSKIWRLD